MIEENSTNTCTHASLSFLLKPREPESNNDKQSLSIGIVAYAKFCGTTFVETAVSQKNNAGVVVIQCCVTSREL